MSEVNKCLILQTPGTMVGGTGKKLNNFIGIEFTRGASNNGGDNGYHKMLGDEELLSSLSLFDEGIKLALINNASTKAILNQTNINKLSTGEAADLSGADGSDVMQRIEGMWAIIGGTDPTYERFIYSDTYFEYGNDKAVFYDAHAEAPDKLVVVDGKSRSIYGSSEGDMGTTKATNISDDLFKSGAGYPTVKVSRDNYERYARAKNSDISSNFPYCNATVHDLEFMLGILYVEMRTKDFTKVFGHGISSNLNPNDSNWDNTSGFRTTVDGVKKYFNFSDYNIYIDGNRKNLWSVFNEQYSFLKVLQAQKEISDGGFLNTVYNSDGIALHGLSKGVMTGIYKKTITFTLNCAFTSNDDAAAHTFELHLCIPVWRGATWMFGNIFQNLSGYEIINYRGAGESADHNLLYRANSIADIITSNQYSTTDVNQRFDIEYAYEFICDLGSVSGWCMNTVTKDGISLAVAMNTGAAINNYQSAYTNVLNNNNNNTRKRQLGGLFGGSAVANNCTPRYCAGTFDFRVSNAQIGGRFRCRLNS